MIKIQRSFNSPIIDEKIQGKSWLVQMEIKDYLSMVSLEQNPFQRSLLSFKFYRKLINDILEDTIIPPISVVYPESDVDLNKGFDESKKFIILDGLQRTNCLLECKRLIEKKESNGKIRTLEKFNKKLLYVEIWESIDLKSILYKMVVLNTGQKKMDYSHQLDILNLSLYKKLLDEKVKAITKKEADKTRRDKDVFLLATICEGLVSFINKSPISGKKNAAEFLFERLNIDSEETHELDVIFDEKTYEYLIWVVKDFNGLLLNEYGTDRNPLLRYDAFFVSFMASLGYCFQKNPDNLEKKMKILESHFGKNKDALKLKIFKQYYKSFKTGIGEKRRKFIFETFKDFFLQSEYADQIEWGTTYDRFF